MNSPAHSKIYTDIIHNLHSYFIYYQALFFVLLSILLCFIARYLVKKCFNKILSKRKSAKSLWNRLVAEALYPPALAMIWIVMASLVLTFSLPVINIVSSDIFYAIIKFGFIITVLWFGMRLITEIRTHVVALAKEREATGDIGGIHAVAKLSQVILLLLGLLFVLPIFNVDIRGLLTLGGVSTLVLGFAAKDSLGNIFGGLMVFMDRSFAVGDWISSPDRLIEGTVEQIGWRMTVIRSFDKRPIYVPNSVFGQIILVNPSRMTNRRIRKIFGVRYDDAKVLPKILEKIRAMLAEHPGISKKQTTLVNITDFSPSAIDFMVYTFTKTSKWADYLLVQDDVMLKCEKIITECGAECAFPTTTMHVPDKISVELGKSIKIKD